MTTLYIDSELEITEISSYPKEKENLRPHEMSLRHHCMVCISLYQ